VATFTGLTAAGGSAEKTVVLTPDQRYVRFIGDIQSGKDMILSAALLGTARFRP
jgi:hypothetical protein